MEKALKQVSAALTGGGTFLVAAHTGPDGDAIGSTFALGHLLARLGKQVTVYNASGLPEQFAWLTPPAPMRNALPATAFDWTVALDCGDRARLGDELAPRFGTQGTINIDHHLGNPGYAQINWVDTRFSSVGEMIARLAADLGVPLSGALGEAVYLAMITDTGYFSYGNTRPETLELAAEILRQGLNPEDFNAKLQNQWSLGRIQLWARVLDTTELHFGGTIGLIRITGAMFEATGTVSADTEGVVNYVRRIKGVQAAVCLREDGPELTKVSLRSSGDINVQAVAAELGGGGHRNAAGCVVPAPIATAQAVVLEAAGRVLGLA